MTILLIGASGYFGAEIHSHILSHSLNVLAPSSQSLDIRDLAQCREFIGQHPEIDTIINCAGLVNWEKCHADHQNAFAINSIGVGNIARIAAEKDIYLIHISSSAVFNGPADGDHSQAYTEEDEPVNLEGVYVTSKFVAEKMVQAFTKRALIIRVGTLFAAHQSSSNFISKILNEIAQGIKKEIPAIMDQKISMTHAGQAAEQIINYCEKQPVGMRHLVNTGLVIPYDFIKQLLKHAQSHITLKPVYLKDIYTIVKRPSYCVLKTRYLDAILPSWQESLADYFRETIAQEHTDL